MTQACHRIRCSMVFQSIRCTRTYQHKHIRTHAHILSRPVSTENIPSHSDSPAIQYTHEVKGQNYLHMYHCDLSRPAPTHPSCARISHVCIHPYTHILSITVSTERMPGKYKVHSDSIEHTQHSYPTPGVSQETTLKRSFPEHSVCPHASVDDDET